MALCAAVVLPFAGPAQAEAPVASQALVLAPVAGVNAVAAAEVPAVLTAPEDDIQVTPIAGGIASFYGRHLKGARTASGERYAPDGLTAAHRTLPFGTQVQVTNPANGEVVVVTINDRGPFHGNRVIDLSDAAADELGITRMGSGKVELAVLGN
ncbi:septal ring lytic transglycosylase RlpA family protein [Novosphingobium sp. fls2-241-R2A-195]|uniref:septal ring lytic transglycosylase RlpA family protein n=1 Tax=Novosphingobium sp. fls2-241-R2A-195 TaxID=3040296 RepID=UPI00254A774F|nr:septal ring lytic transglycosylase RlpA family protein [Novosphingobium sp. fls2-241-R2A-195]